MTFKYVAGWWLVACLSVMLCDMAVAQSIATGALEKSSNRVSFRETWFIISVLGAIKLVLHLLVNGRYGYFRDELYYIACSRHLDWGYVDQPPLIALSVRLSRLLFGDSLLGLRLFAALAMITVIALVVLTVRELGGGRFAMWLAGLCVFFGPIWLSLGYIMTMNSYEQVIWTACALLVIRFINTRDPRLWLWFGILCGIGLENKYAITVLGLGVVLGLLFTPERRVFFDKWIWLGGAAALLIFLPNLIWNFRHHWPFFELMHNIRVSGKDVVLTPGQFLFQQALLTLPVSVVVWVSGLAWLMFSRTGSRDRVIGWTFLIVVITFMVLHGKNYYSTPVYPVMFAAGAVALETWLSRPRRQWIGWAYLVVIAAAGIAMMPITVPVLPVDAYLRYQEKLPFKIPKSEHSHERAVLPQVYADQLGWTEIVQAIAQAWNQIPETDRNDCAIFGQDYGVAGAIDFFGLQYGLPKALSAHQNYYFWGPGGYSGNCMVVVGDRAERLHELFEDVRYVTTSAPNPYALETELGVFICRRAKFGSLEKLWPSIKVWR
jgi:hypothetical protein